MEAVSEGSMLYEIRKCGNLKKNKLSTMGHGYTFPNSFREFIKIYQILRVMRSLDTIQNTPFFTFEESVSQPKA